MRAPTISCDGTRIQIDSESHGVATHSLASTRICHASRVNSCAISLIWQMYASSDAVADWTCTHAPTLMLTLPLLKL